MLGPACIHDRGEMPVAYAASPHSGCTALDIDACSIIKVN
jgi:hypothetical protein